MSDALFNPTPSTLISVINNSHFISLSGLTTNLISKHLLKNIVTAKGHLDQEWMNLQPTNILPTQIPTPPSPPHTFNDDINSLHDLNNKLSRDIMCMMIDTQSLISKS